MTAGHKYLCRPPSQALVAFRMLNDLLDRFGRTSQLNRDIEPKIMKRDYSVPPNLIIGRECSFVVMIPTIDVDEGLLWVGVRRQEEWLMVNLHRNRFSFEFLQGHETVITGKECIFEGTTKQEGGAVASEGVMSEETSMFSIGMSSSPSKSMRL